MSFCFARRLHPQFVSILEQIFLGPLSCPRKLRLVQVPIFPPLSKSCSSTQAENTFWKEFMSKSFGHHFTQNQVPILNNWGPLPMWERWHWYWVYSRILFLHFCILILLYMSTSCRGPWRKAFSAKVPSFVVLSRIPVSFRCSLNFCIFRFFGWWQWCSWCRTDDNHDNIGDNDPSGWWC